MREREDEWTDLMRSAISGDDAAYANALYGFSVAKAAVDHATGRSLAKFQATR